MKDKSKKENKSIVICLGDFDGDTPYRPIKLTQDQIDNLKKVKKK